MLGNYLQDEGSEQARDKDACEIEKLNTDQRPMSRTSGGLISSLKLLLFDFAPSDSD